MIRNRKILIVLGVMLFIGTLLPYLQTGTYDFVRLDDLTYARQNAHVSTGLALGNIGWALTSLSYAGIWMPLTWLSYMLDFSLHSGNPSFMHLHNALFHAINAVLLFLLLVLLLQNTRQPVSTLYREALVPPPSRAGGEDAAPPGTAETRHLSRWRDGVLAVRRVFSSASRRKKSSVNSNDANTNWMSTIAVYIIAAMGAAFWSLHPLRVESVAWIASRKDVLSLFWELLALLVWLKYVIRPDSARDDATGSRLRRLSLGFFILALMSKPSAMTFPILAALLEYMVTGRVILKRHYDSLSIAFMGACLAVAAQRAGGATLELASVPFFGRVVNAIASIGTYARDTVWPFTLAVPYPHRWPEQPLFLAPSMVICAVACVVLTWATFKRYRAKEGNQTPSGFSLVVFTALLWILVSMAPMLGLSNFGFHSHADRFTYLPSIGLSLLLCCAVQSIFGRSTKVGTFGCVALFSVVLMLGMQTHRQTAYWRNDETLFTHTLNVTGGSTIVHGSLGLYYFQKSGCCDQALYHFGRAIAMGTKDVPHPQRAFYVLMLAESGKIKEAKDQALLINAHDERQDDDQVVSSLIAYGAIELFSGDPALAGDHLRKAKLLNKNISDVHYLLGRLAEKEGHLAEARREWDTAASLDMRFEFLKKAD